MGQSYISTPYMLLEKTPYELLNGKKVAVTSWGGLREGDWPYETCMSMKNKMNLRASILNSEKVEGIVVMGKFVVSLLLPLLIFFSFLLLLSYSSSTCSLCVREREWWGDGKRVVGGCERGKVEDRSCRVRYGVDSKSIACHWCHRCCEIVCYVLSNCSIEQCFVQNLCRLVNLIWKFLEIGILSLD